MKTALAVLVLVLLSFGCVFAYEEVDTSGLTKEQKARLQIQAEQMKKELADQAQEKTAKSVKDTSKEWIEIGQMIGQAFASSAKELNVAVNDFAHTPVGQVTMVAICWKVFGKEILHFLVGGALLLFGIPIWLYLFRRICLIDEIKYGPGWWIFRAKTITYITPNSTTWESRFGMIALLAAFVGVSLLVMFG